MTTQVLTRPQTNDTAIFFAQFIPRAAFLIEDSLELLSNKGSMPTTNDSRCGNNAARTAVRTGDVEARGKHIPRDIHQSQQPPPASLRCF